jgi:hypothetical protein
MNRKSFIQNSARLFFLGTFAGGTIYMAKSKRLTAPGKCDKNDQCKACGSFQACTLPQAIKQGEYDKL